VSREAGQPTLAEVREARHRHAVDDARADPVVAAILARFPGAEIVDVQFGAGKAEGEPAFDDTGDWTAGYGEIGGDDSDE
jgi:DNA polymerase III subunit gamma/tau